MFSLEKESNGGLNHKNDLILNFKKIEKIFKTLIYDFKAFEVLSKFKRENFEKKNKES